MSGCKFNGVYTFPLPGAVANGAHTYSVKVQFQDVQDLVPYSAVKVDDASISTASVDRGFLLRFDGKPALALIGEADLFGKRRPVAAPSADPAARATALVLQLAVGDYVVHETNGVGRYLGMVTRTVAGISRDYLLIEYSGDDRLYVPVESLDVITKYAGGEAPRLNRLGSGDWEKARSRARRAVQDIAKVKEDRDFRVWEGDETRIFGDAERGSAQTA